MLAGAIAFVSVSCVAQSQNQNDTNQFWGTLNVSLDLGARARITTSVETRNGDDPFYQLLRAGAVFSYRVKGIGKHLLHEVDKEDEYNVVIGGGYEFLQTKQNGATQGEHRVLLQATPKYLIGAKIFLQDRSRIEFRWMDQGYNFRYRNKLTIGRRFRINRVRFTPYASGELFWDRNQHLWNQNRYAFGVQLPYKKSFILEPYYLRRNCSTCSPDSANVLGMTLSLYFDWPKKTK
jgi:hypothetical protein